MTKKRILTVLILPLVYALMVRLIFGMHSLNEYFSMMSVAFLFLMPLAIGFITVVFADPIDTRTVAAKLFLPWISVITFLIWAWLTHLEGWPCLVLITPILLIMASIGGLIGGSFSNKRHNKTYGLAWMMLPLVISPLEQQLETSAKPYQAYTFIDIHAPDQVIWKHVTRVKEIPASWDKGWLTKLLNFPRPIKAELNYEGVGAYREAIFTNGLVFHETVTRYEHLRKMSFNIRAFPHEIPLTTMDEHLVIGGKYFDVLQGTYALEVLNATTCRLHLYSHFKLSTHFNFYAAWWAEALMKDIQNNILQVEKRRAEMDAHWKQS